jgi:predicted O-methyltransferase YrrM
VHFFKPNFFLILSYLPFLWKAIRPKNELPPAIHEIYNEVIRKSRNQKIPEIEKIRLQLSQSTDTVDFQSFGAPSKVLNHKPQLVSKIAASSLSSSEDAFLIASLAKHLKAKNVLELGTSLGITTAYLKSINPDSEITSMEGNEMILNIAKKNNLEPINFVSGNIDENLPPTLKNIKQLDFVIIDANHTRLATQNYFEQVLPKCHENSCIAIDDIYWSKGMNNAWKTIIGNPKVTFSIDLFGMGLIFFIADHKKQHFNLLR